MMAALGHWAARQGARYAYVQVATANEPAIGAYTTLGFVPSPLYRSTTDLQLPRGAQCAALLSRS